MKNRRHANRSLVIHPCSLDADGFFKKILFDAVCSHSLQKFFSFIYEKNSDPITPAGKRVFQSLLDKKIWIDLSHASQDVLDYFMQIRPKGYPLLVTHTVLAKYYGTDRGVSDDLLKKIALEGGAVGLLNSSDMLRNTPVELKSCKKDTAFLTQWQEMKEVLGSSLFLGSDLNSPIPSIPAETHNDCQGKKVSMG